MPRHWQDRLSAYLDGELSVADHAACERHLTQCAPCRTTLANLDRVRTGLRHLPEIPPASDLWSGIAPRLDPKPSRILPFTARVTVPAWALAAAAAVVAVLSATGVWFAVRSSPAGLPIVTAMRTDVLLTPTAFSLDNSVAPMIDEFEQILAERRDELDPETIRVVEGNLRAIDFAIQEIRAALASDPNNAFLNRYLAGAMQHKLDVLRRLSLEEPAAS